MKKFFLLACTVALLVACGDETTEELQTLAGTTRATYDRDTEICSVAGDACDIDRNNFTYEARLQGYPHLHCAFAACPQRNHAFYQLEYIREGVFAIDGSETGTTADATVENSVAWLRSNRNPDLHDRSIHGGTAVWE